jgi:hypothetical protein
MDPAQSDEWLAAKKERTDVEIFIGFLSARQISMRNFVCQQIFRAPVTFSLSVHLYVQSSSRTTRCSFIKRDIREV